MAYDNIPGSFGSNNTAEINRANTNNSSRRNIFSNINFRLISPERWVDIVCCSLIAVFLITVICIWPSFSEALFENILFPIIYVGSKIVALIAAIGAGTAALFARFRRRRYWL